MTTTTGTLSAGLAAVALLTLLYLIFFARGAGPKGIFVAACCGAVLPVFASVAAIAWNIGGIAVNLAAGIAAAFNGAAVG
jgi:hypothetical protein